ncbi:ABC transporter permease [Frigidibacter oleivorans]|uniref:ABC transporter permease n=1 Tax=Frigidibacter oleivorans TaxID=2487129 RepID=UPI000F8E312C|nr:ABC transporter permease [Frigidibacter oleivorans]
MLNAVRPAGRAATGPAAPARRGGLSPRARVIGALVLREMQTVFGRSPGGYLWALAEPLAAIALLSLGFSIALRAPALGSSFALFYATGWLPFMLFLDLSGRVAQAGRFSRPLFAYPPVRLTDALIARFLLGFGTHLVILLLVLAGLRLGLAAPMDPRAGPILRATGSAGLLAFGAGAVNCALFAVWPLWERVWQILTRPLFVVSGLFFLPDAMPHPWAGRLMLNPVAQVVADLRRGIYPGYDPPGLMPVYPLLLGLALLTLGLFLVRRCEGRILGSG